MTCLEILHKIFKNPHMGFYWDFAYVMSMLWILPTIIVFFGGPDLELYIFAYLLIACIVEYEVNKY
jgi:hypothetical protein